MQQRQWVISEKEFALDSIEIKNVKNQGKVLFDGLQKALDAHIESMADIQKRLGLDYNGYSFYEEKKINKKQDGRSISPYCQALKDVNIAKN